MALTFLLFSLIFFQHSIFAQPAGCFYKAATQTDAYYLTQNADEINNNKLKCFSLSNSDINSGLCCYYNDGTQQLCANNEGNTGYELQCPTSSIIANNCGMALFFQPQSAEECTEISLVDGFCCYVETTSHGKACVRTDEIDEDDKTKITDEIRNAVNKLKLASTTETGDVKITSVKCEGYYMKFFGLSLLLLSVML